MKKEQFQISLDHAILINVKESFDKCLQAAIAKAISTGVDEGSASLKISFEVFQYLNDDTGEYERRPLFKFKTGYSVPTKESFDGEIGMRSKLLSGPNGYMLINNQISIDELFNEE